MAIWLTTKYKQAINPGKLEPRDAEDLVRYLMVASFASLLILSSLLFNTPEEIFIGMQKIIVSPSILVTDYFALANIGTGFFNSGILLLLGLTVARRGKVHLTGPVIAALLTLAGFSFFGKNLYNSWAVPFGVYLYAKYRGEHYSKYIIFALFGTALGPMTSLVSFGMGFPVSFGIVAGNLIGVLAGFFISPLALHFVNFHQGYNLYNIGFTAGMIGTFFMGMFRAFGYESKNPSIIASGYNLPLGIYLYVMFSLVLLLGLYLNHWSLRGLTELFSHSGKLVSDFIQLAGLGVTLINMALLGMISTTYVLLVGGELNGPILGGIFTIFGFGAFGKHVKNTIPIFIGVFLASRVHIYDTHSTSALLAALFGTTLAPISGAFGWPFGILAGFLHMSMVVNVGYLHGGVNLYNNGFSGGFIAAGLVPVIEALFRKKPMTQPPISP